MQAAIFDMDGLLIDSEPLWKKAEIKVFGSVGLTLTAEMLRQIEGTRLDEAVAFWYNYQPWSNKSQQEVAYEILEEISRLVDAEGKMLEGVTECLEFFAMRNIQMALASSSPILLIEKVLQRFSLQKYFSIVHSAQFEPFGKPHPGIFITTARLMNVSPMHCLVFEDSLNGVVAAKAARMKCVAVPHAEVLQNPKFEIADLIIPSLKKFDSAFFNSLKN